MSDETLLLVDGSSFLYRAFHALPDLRNGEGEPTGAVYGMVAMLRRLRNDGKLGGGARMGAVVFDAPGPTFRDDWYPEYKATRKAMPDDLRKQIPVIHELVRALGWPLVMVEGIEADDVIGTLARQASERGMKTVVATGDKDLAQLVDDKVVLVDTMTRDSGPPKPLDRDAVVEKFGVPPERIVDWLTLVGDTVDNVPGVPKCGPKTAVKWLEQYGSLDEVLAHADEIKGVVGENLRQSLEWLPTARKLVTVKTDCELPEEFAEFESGLVLADDDDERLRELYTRCGFRTWLRELEGEAPRQPARVFGAGPAAGGPTGGPADGGAAGTGEAAAGRATGSDETAQQPGHPVYETVLTDEQLDAWIARIGKAELVAFDTETTSLDPMRAELVGLSLSVEPWQACYVPVAHDYAGAPGQLGRDHVLGKLRAWLESPKHHKVGQNLKYDAHVLENHGVRLAGIEHDTLLQSYVLEAHRSHDMDSLAERHLQRRTIRYDEVTGKGASRIGFEQVAVERATEYAAEDADVTLHLHRTLYPRIAEDERLLAIYRDIEVPVSVILQRVERNGVLVDVQALAKQSDELGRKLMALEKQAHEVAGQPFNLNSPKQLGEILFGNLKLPVVKKTASGAPSTDEEVLAKLAEDYPLPRLLLDWRALAKLKSTYTDKLPQMVDPKTGRVHTSYSQAVAVTGRLASSDPNLQNIPVRTPEGRRIREAFVAPAGAKIVSADYSQIELRIMAHISADAGLRRAFAEGMDVHRATASEVFGVAPADVSAEQRRYAKVINFGLIYGMSAFGLAQNLGIERDAAKNWIDRYFARYPGVREYMDRTRALAHEQGYVETVFGRRLWLAEINSPNGPRRSAAERAAINAPMQGTAADLIKMAMIAVQRWLDDEGLQSKLIMQVHDELVLEVPDGELDLVRERLPGLMTGVAKLDVPLEVEVGVGANWEQAH
ncbi:DNA polymerase I [Burkholderiaceae bacterium FT117]|uniref:DNA polymerase I n=1 Tax=Zeimonas sediminis TaxID=2944268 RepID=UPI002342D7C0|nr:DNA polymerase I [Zeimonas sediminis]MCM5569982.1 DNA polymerase I [Zeimonas sediminis]